MEDEEYDILREDFALYPGKIKFCITLTNRRIRITQSSNGSRKNDDIMLDDVTGCHILQAKKNNIASAYLCIFSYPLKKKALGSSVVRQRVTKTFTIDCNRTYQENSAVAEVWKMTIKRLVAGEIIRTKEDTENGSLATRNLLVLVNPFSGRKKATAMYKEKVKPMLLEAEIKHTVRNTEHAGHAREIAKNLKLSDWDGIVIVSGDGLVHEVINGLMDRPDWQEAIEMPIGIVPGGSGNALAAAIVYASTGLHDVARSATLCMFEICRGLSRPMDLVAMETSSLNGANTGDSGDGDGARNINYSFMGLSLGLIADIDMESESIRCLGGELRTAIYSIIRIIFLRRYDIEVSYLPYTSHHAQSQVLNEAGDPGINRDCRYYDGKEMSSDWVTERDRYNLVLASYLTHLATNVLVQKQCALDCGKIYLTLNDRASSRRECIKAYNLMTDGFGLHNFDDPDKCAGRTIECRAIRIVPKERRHAITADGEALPFGALHCWVVPGVARVMCSAKG